MLKLIRGPDQQGVDPANHTGTKCAADDKLKCLHQKIAGIGTLEVTAARLTPYVLPKLFCTVLYASSKEYRERDMCDSEH